MQPQMKTDEPGLILILGALVFSNFPIPDDMRMDLKSVVLLFLADFCLC